MKMCWLRTNRKFPKTATVLLIMWAVLVSSAQTSNPSATPVTKEAKAKAFYDEGTRLISLDTRESWLAAVEKYEQARRLYGELGDKFREKDATFLLGFVNNHIGLLYDGSYEKQKALDYYNRALPFYIAAEDKTGEGDTLNNIGKVYDESGEKRKALEYYEWSARIFHAIGAKGREGRSLNNIGGVYHDLGEMGKALEFLLSSLPLNKAGGDKSAEARTLTNIGMLYWGLGNIRKALEYHNQALIIQKTIDDRLGMATTLNNIGLAHTKLNEMQDALEAFGQALSIDNVIGNKIGVSRTLNNIGSVYLRMGENQKALAHFNQSLEISRVVGDRDGEAVILVNIGSIYDGDQKQKGRALEHYDQALAIFKSLGNKSGESTACHNIMLAWEALNKPKFAIVYGKQAVNLQQELRQAIRSFDKETQGTYLEDIQSTYRKLAELLISEGRLFEAQAVLDLLKSEEYGQLTRRGEPADTIPYGKAEAEVVAKIENLVSLERQRGELVKLKTRSTEQDAKLEQLRLDIAAANKAFDVALDALGKAEVSASARVDEIRGGQEIQSALQLLGRETKSGAVALYTVLGTHEEKSAAQNPGGNNRVSNAGVQIESKFGWVIMVTEKGYKAYPIDVTTLEENVFQFRTALSSDKYNPQPWAEKIYNAIFRQVSPKLKRTLEDDLSDYLRSRKDKTLMWSLDGVLRYIPMSALHDGKRYLVENYRNVVFTKQSFLWLTKENQADWQALGLGVSEKRENFDALPGVKTELETIVREPNRQTGIMNGSIKLNGNFKKQTFFNTVGNGSFPVVHIASHYSFNPAQQDASFLLVGDGRLTFSELKENKNLFGTVDLLTLSACDTGVSGNGREAEGFAYLAQSLGARSVIASLWKVSDTGTPELMIRFYKLRAENPLTSKGEAFRQAQLSLFRGDSNDTKNISPKSRSEKIGIGKKTDLTLFVKDEKKPFAHPHYWSSFVLIGNWR